MRYFLSLCHVIFDNLSNLKPITFSSSYFELYSFHLPPLWYQVLHKAFSCRFHCQRICYITRQFPRRFQFLMQSAANYSGNRETIPTTDFLNRTLNIYFVLSLILFLRLLESVMLSHFFHPWWPSTKHSRGKCKKRSHESWGFLLYN